MTCDVLQVVSRLLGSWLGFVDWDGVCYWDINKNTPHPVHRSPNPLPSDSRYRLVVMVVVMMMVVVLAMMTMMMMMLRRGCVDFWSVAPC